MTSFFVTVVFRTLKGRLFFRLCLLGGGGGGDVGSYLFMSKPSYHRGPYSQNDGRNGGDTSDCNTLALNNLL